MRLRFNHIITLLIAATLCIASADAASKRRTQQRDIKKVRAEQQANKKAIKETSQKITVNTRETKRQLSQLQALEGEIAEKNREIGAMREGIDSIDGGITRVNDSIGSIEKRFEVMRANYAAQLRQVQRSRGAMNAMSFLFSSESFGTAWQRVRYMRQVNKWRGRNARRMKAMGDSLAERRRQLDTLMSSRRTAMARLSLAQKQLQGKQQDTDKLVASLKAQGSSLRAVLKEKEQQQRQLDRELEKLIAEEQRREEQRRREEAKKAAAAKAKADKEAAAKAKADKAAGKSTETANSGTTSPKTVPAKNRKEAPTAVADADRALTGSFESNKGRLLFPVAGRYRVVRGFGRQKHPELEHVETENSGIDIEALGGGSARAVFEGRVSEIFRQPGYNTIVMVRHGNFLTIYANIDKLSVKKGDTVKAGQAIGTIFADPDEDGRLILHFELRKERTKLNPLLWVK